MLATPVGKVGGGAGRALVRLGNQSPSQSPKPSRSRQRSKASSVRSFLVTAKGMSEADAGQIRQDLPHERFIL